VIPQSLLTFAVGALFQDLVFLCIIFRLLEELAGTWLAGGVALGLFSVAHAFNPDATAGSTLSLFVTSLVILAPFILTRRVWMSWGFHAGWNFMQAGVFGMPNSGYEFPSWIQPVIDGPQWLTGGAFGIEASMVAVALDVVLGTALLTMAVRHGQLGSRRDPHVVST
jgi:membrane protease YdiL (CAAX protease family)